MSDEHPAAPTGGLTVLPAGPVALLLEVGGLDQVLALDVSNEIAIVAMLGGAGTVLGPIVGAAVLETASEIFKNTFKEAHLLIFGVLLVVVVLFLPGGIVGALTRWLHRGEIAGERIR